MTHEQLKNVTFLLKQQSFSQKNVFCFNDPHLFLFRAIYVTFSGQICCSFCEIMSRSAASAALTLRILFKLQGA